jgi:hypothetical protein
MECFKNHGFENGGFEKKIFLFLATPMPADCRGAAGLVPCQEDGGQALPKRAAGKFWFG